MLVMRAQCTHKWYGSMMLAHSMVRLITNGWGGQCPSIFELATPEIYSAFTAILAVEC